MVYRTEMMHPCMMLWELVKCAVMQDRETRLLWNMRSGRDTARADVTCQFAMQVT
jgi:hypothetical protein